jgi:hypothetical protein
LLYKTSTIKGSNFGDVSNIGKNYFSQVLRVSCVLQDLKFPPEFVSCLTHSWGAVVFSVKDGVSSGEMLVVLFD